MVANSSFQNSVAVKYKPQPNKSMQRNWQARFLINRLAPTKAHYGERNLANLANPLISSVRQHCVT